MSAPSSCCNPCDPATVVEVPGTQGEPGAPGTDGADGVNAYTVTTASITLPAEPGAVTNPAVQSLANTSWMAVGQIILISDGTNVGTFRVLTITSSTGVTLEWLDYDGDSSGTTVIASGAKVVSSGAEPVVTSPLPIANGGTASATVQAAITALGLKKTPLSVYASGTAYSLTNTAAALTFGTTSPALVINAAGVYLILARVRVDYNGATFAAVRTGTIKIRRTNNTAADQISTGFKTDIITTLTYTLADIVIAPLIYTTTNSNDALAIYGDISVVPSAGSLDCVEAEIVAVRLYDQTL